MSISSKTKKIIKRYLKKIRCRIRSRKYYYSHRAECIAKQKARRVKKKQQKKKRNPILRKYVSKIRKRLNSRKKYALKRAVKIQEQIDGILNHQHFRVKRKIGKKVDEAPKPLVELRTKIN